MVFQKNQVLFALYSDKAMSAPLKSRIDKKHAGNAPDLLTSGGRKKSGGEKGREWEEGFTGDCEKQPPRLVKLV